jgi:CRISPR-associated DxTHG motif protein
MNNLLITALGLNPREARYTLGAESVVEKLAPLALVQLLPPERKPSRVRALCTAQAERETFPLLREGCERQGIPDVAAVPVDDGASDLAGFRSALEAACPREDRTDGILFDATHGFRHLTLLTYLAAQYLSVLRGIELRGYYGLLVQGRDVAPFVDLGPMLEQTEWLHALRRFKDAGDARLLAERIEATGRPDARPVASELRVISEAREAGLPLELGRACRAFLGRHRKPLSRNLGLADALFADELEELLLEPLEGFGLARGTANPEGPKTAIALDEQEIHRHERLIDDLLARGRVATAMGLMNEVIVSRVILAHGWQGEWLEFGTARRRAAAALDSLQVEESTDAGLRRRLGGFWKTLSDVRNSFNHYGHRPQILLGRAAHDFESKLEQVREDWKWVKALPALDLRLRLAHRRLLVSPVGRKPGVLFSALRTCRNPEADACLAVVSAETEAGARQATSRAEFEGHLEILAMRRPLDGAAEIRELAERARPHLLQAEEVAVNLTGGTTIMGLAVERIARDAEKLGRPVRRFVLVDERPEAMQAEDPYREGKPFWLDGVDADGK